MLIHAMCLGCDELHVVVVWIELAFVRIYAFLNVTVIERRTRWTHSALAGGCCQLLQ